MKPEVQTKWTPTPVAIWLRYARQHSRYLKMSAANKEEAMKDLDDQVEKMATAIGEKVGHTAKRLSQREKQVRYSDEAIRFSMIIWLKSKSGYELLRNSGSSITLPSGRTLSRYKSTYDTVNGFDPKNYKLGAEEYEPAESAGKDVILLCDEMKLKCGIAWNTKTHKLSGFVDEALNVDSLIANLSSVDTAAAILNEDKFAKTVNQWQVVIMTTGKSFLGDHWCSSKPVSGTELINQFRIAVRGCEAVGFRVHGFCSDAGGGNASMMRILRTAGSTARTTDAS